MTLTEYLVRGLVEERTARGEPLTHRQIVNCLLSMKQSDAAGEYLANLDWVSLDDVVYEAVTA